MDESSQGVRLSPPQAFRIQDVRVDLKKLFLKLGEAVAKGSLAAAKHDPLAVGGHFISAVFGASDALSINDPPEVRAWHLVQRALMRAIGELVGEWLAGRPPYQGDLDHIQARFHIVIEDADVRIGLDSFKNPTALPLLPAARRIFEDWLRLYDATEAQAASLAKRLDSYFAVALHDEWRSSPGKYQPLLEALDSPIAAAARMEQDWERYRLLLIKQFNQPVFEESFGLSQIYVPLRGAYREIVKRATVESSPDSGPKPHRHSVGEREERAVVVDLEKNIISWLQQAKADDAIRLIRGGPGSGKSTFAKKVAHDVTVQSGMRVLFIPLQQFRMHGRLTDSVGEVLGNEGSGAFDDNPLQQKNFATPHRPILLIFDGLDELTKPGDLADQDTKLFLEELRLFVDRSNESGGRVFSLITGRSAVVQANRNFLRLSDRQELEVLRLLVTKDDKNDRNRLGRPFCDPDGILDRDQRHDWWQNYAICKAGEPREMPAILQKDDVHDLSPEPLLLYLRKRPTLTA